MTVTVVSHSPEQTREIARKTGALLRGGEILAYRGGMGAGKTTFTRGLAGGMGLPEQEVSSPTFTLVNEYEADSASLRLCHFDMYRLPEGETLDLETTGFWDYLDSHTVLAVEWSEHLRGCLPPETIFIELKRSSSNEAGEDDFRCIVITAPEGDDRFAFLGN